MTRPAKYSAHALQIKPGRKIRAKLSFLLGLFIVTLNLYTAMHAGNMSIVPNASHMSACSFRGIGIMASGFTGWFDPKRKKPQRVITMTTPMP